MMKIQLLGTGAADGIPGFFCNNEVSRFARENGGKDVRSRAAALIDGVLKIDLPPDTLTQINRERLNPRDWSAMLFTHSHDDHFAPGEIQYAMYPFTELEFVPYTIYANPFIAEAIRTMYPDWPIEVVETHSFQPFQHGPYAITPIRAHHLADEDCHNFLFQKDNKTLLYATDTGIWDDETFEFLQDFKLDGLIIECTEGYRRTDYLGHLNFEDLELVLSRLSHQRTTSSATQIVTTHHASTGGATHADLECVLAKLNATPGYDGLVIEI